MLSVLERLDRHRCHVSRRIKLDITRSRLLLHSKLAIRSSANLRLGFMGKEITPSRWMFCIVRGTFVRLKMSEPGRCQSRPYIRNWKECEVEWCTRVKEAVDMN